MYAYSLTRRTDTAHRHGLETRTGPPRAIAVVCEAASPGAETATRASTDSKYMSRFFLFVVFLVVLPAGRVAAQVPRTVQETLPPAARARLVPDDPTLRFRTRRVPGGRVDVDEGVFRAAYRLDLAPRATDEATARAALRATAAAFGWAPDAPDLVLERVRTTPRSRHLAFRQTFHGLPVHNRRVQVNLDRDGRPVMVLSGYAPRLAEVPAFDVRPAFDAADATRRALQHVTGGAGQTTTPALVVVPGTPPRLAWHLVAWQPGVPAEWNLLLDAHTGALISLFDQTIRAHDAPFIPPSDPRPAWSTPPPSAARITGSGFVFDPDPLSTAGSSYGPPYVDADDADGPELTAALVRVDLPDITLGTDGLYRLIGPFVEISGDNFAGTRYTPPAEAAPDGFQYTRAHDGFEAVMAYYHLDKSQRYVQALGFFDRQNDPIEVNPQGFSTDNSLFFPSRNALAFGTGGVDDAEDATVLWHEYGHALLEAASPGILDTQEGRALHEGWADYWAASYARSLVEAGAVQRDDWDLLFKWDSGEGTVWAGRRVDHPGHYPEDICSARPGGAGCSEHDDGRIWAATLMEIYDDLGRTTTDLLTLYSHTYLSAPVTMADAAEALLQADLDQFDGAHQSVLLARLGARGFVDPAAFGPVLIHTPLRATEVTTGTLRLDVTAAGASAPVDSVVVHYGPETTSDNVLVLSSAGDDLFTGDLPLPGQAGTVFYYLEAFDTLGRSTRLPASAPTETFQFNVGPDHEPPTVTHEPVTAASLAIWPVEVVATVDDDLGVDSVWVSYTVEDPDGVPTETGAFGLTRNGALYRGLFPVPVGRLQPNSVMLYRLHARDRAMAANETTLPDGEPFAFLIVAEGVLRAFNFETPGQDLTATGAWAAGPPTFGLNVAHSGHTVWATAPDGTYPATPTRSTLALPPVNLADVGQPVYLVFWHWYDFEHNGLVEPGVHRQGRILWDGGNVKVSTDGGATWTVLTPEGGYSGTLFDTANPLGKEPAFGGYSFGWRQEVVPLPVADDVRIRFEAGTDDGNTDIAVNYAGWYLDDLSITTERPRDEQPPRLTLAPPALTVLSTRAVLPPLVVQVEDDLGVADVVVPFEVVTADGTERDTLRLAMRPTDLATYEGTLRTSGVMRPGDAITYRILLTDVTGTQVMVPDPDLPPFRFEYRLVETIAVLETARPSGLWQRAGATWTTAGGPDAPDRSSLVLDPLDLPVNAADLNLTLEHRYAFGDGLGGNLKASTDDGRTWTVLTPAAGYPAVFPAGAAHPMAGEPVFGGASEGFTLTAFDLSAFAGRQLRLRLDLGAARPPATGEFWDVQQATLGRSTTAPAFDVPRELRLLANFPDPFSTTTTISYTLPETMPVDLTVFDVLGRRMARLVHAVESPGTYTLSLDGSRLAAGVYFLRLVAGGTLKVERMVVTH